MTLSDRLARVQERIDQAARRAGRSPDEISLVAVTKSWPAETVLAAYEAGIRHFGENRTDEFVTKQAAVAEQLGADNDSTWHYIGALQSRQSHDVADHADLFHALDRIKIANRLSRRLRENGRSLPVFLEVNVSGEGSKAGFDCDRWEDDGRQREALQQAAARVAGLPGLHPLGLMTMAPWDAEEAVIRRVFRRTRALAQWLQTTVPDAGWSCLSMGMTDDFEIAIEEGATHVRVGRAIFGERSG